MRNENVNIMRVRKGGLVLLPCALVAMLVMAIAAPSVTWAEGKDAQTDTSSDAASTEFTSVDQLYDKKLAMINGSSFDTILLHSYDEIHQDNFLYYNSNAESIAAVKARKADAMITDLPVAQLAVSRNDGIGIMPERLVEDHYAVVLAKGSPYTELINERIRAYREDGTLEALYKKWTGADESAKTMPNQDWEAAKGTLTVAASADSEPMAYQVGSKACGMGVEMLYLVARDLGYGIRVRSMAPGSLINEVQSGKADIATSCFSITEERKKMVDMTEAFYDGGIVAVTRTNAVAAAGEGDDFFTGLGKSFERTFITENRWQLILSGLGVTLIISVVSGALGLALGFLFVMLRRKKEGGVAEKVIGALEGLLGGLPVVVVLMVFYYVVFGAIDVPGMVVAMLVFTLLFGTTSGSIMWNAIRAIDIGQTEAGRALGFGDRDTFFLVVLPQAARQFAPLLRSQFVSLIKDTSVVGYIAVQDLTRVGDLIRARTMEAFFPLIATAIIYFVICRLFTWLLGMWIKKLEPKEGPRTIEGVELY
ncbi:MAG: transporter substrate-binding domain-containing protein [Atopobiaceae bacterium]|nr:transporter substrate-binding domain-containing protein [Atopobiaceae bacterium]